MPHTTAPFYSLLVKFDPFEYPKIVPDLAESWTISPDGKVYEFKLRSGVKFHDGSALTSHDVKASLDHVIFPPTGVTSPRRAVYRQVASVEAPNPGTVRVTLKQASPAMLTFLASPWNYIYKADLLEKDPHWFKKNVMGTGPFKLGEYVPGSHVLGKKNPDYFVKGLPYLDGFRALFIPDGAARVAALRGGRVAADFVGATPVLDQASLKQAIGDKLVIQKSNWTCVLTIAFNHEKKPFDDARVRRALSLALDRREAARVLNDFTEYGTVAGISQPGAPYAMPPAELEKVPGYWPDIEKSRAEAKRLLKEAGIPDGFAFAFTNRSITGAQRVGVYVIDQWRKIGLNATHRVLETGPYFTALRSGDYEASVDFSCDFADEPDLQLTKYLSSDKTPDQLREVLGPDARRPLRAAEPGAEPRPAQADRVGVRAPAPGRDGAPGGHPRPGAGRGALGLRQGLEGDAVPLPQPGSRNGLARALASGRLPADGWRSGAGVSSGRGRARRLLARRDLTG